MKISIGECTLHLVYSKIKPKEGSHKRLNILYSHLWEADDYYDLYLDRELDFIILCLKYNFFLEEKYIRRILVGKELFYLILNKVYPNKYSKEGLYSLYYFFGEMEDAQYEEVHAEFSLSLGKEWTEYSCLSELQTNHGNEFNTIDDVRDCFQLVNISITEDENGVEDGGFLIEEFPPWL